MTASAPLRLVSLCQMNSASWPSTCLSGVIRVVVAIGSGKDDDGEFHAVGLVSDLDAIALDDRIGQQLVGGFRRERARLVRYAALDLELEVLALPDVLHRRVAERVQRVGDGCALRIEHRRLESDEHTRTHQTAHLLKPDDSLPKT